MKKSKRTDQTGDIALDREILALDARVRSLQDRMRVIRRLLWAAVFRQRLRR
jgi:hypothetical protein